MNKELLRTKLKEAMKAKDPSLSTLRVIIGEIDLQEVKESKPLDSDRIYKIIRKIKEGCEETVKHRESVELTNEITFLEGLLPQQLSLEDTRILLSEVGDSIIAAKSEGQAIGIAMKHCKGKAVDSALVSSIVRIFRCTQ